jgi:hypothetical protein
MSTGTLQLEEILQTSLATTETLVLKSIEIWSDVNFTSSNQNIGCEICGDLGAIWTLGNAVCTRRCFI